MLTRTIYHIKDGAKEMYDIDARQAVANFPEEWSNDPWPGGAAVVEQSGDDPMDALRRDLTATTNAELRKMAEAEGISVETDDNKATLVDKIIAGRRGNAGDD